MYSRIISSVIVPELTAKYPRAQKCLPQNFFFRCGNSCSSTRGWRAKQRDLLVGLDLSSALTGKSQINPAPKWSEHYIGKGGIGEIEAFLSASHRKFEEDEQSKLEQFERELLAEKQLREIAEGREEALRSSGRRTKIFSYIL